MRNINLKTSLFLVVGISFIVFLLLVTIKNVDVNSPISLLKLIPKVVSIDALIVTVFSFYLWKWRVFKGWLVPFPNLNGTWEGEIQSTWVNPQTGEVPAPIPAILTIKQSFFKISCVMRTAEMNSISCIADFILDKENQIKRLCYTYDSKPLSTIRERSPIHCGTQLFDIIEIPNMKLEGEYWTGRKTTGHIVMKFQKTERIDHFPTDMPPHPLSGK